MKAIITWTKDTGTAVKSYDEDDCKTVFEARKRRAAELGCDVSEVMGRRTA